MNLKKLTLTVLGCALLASCGGRGATADGVVNVDFHSYQERPLAEMTEPFFSSRRYVALHSDDQNLMIGEIGKVVLRGDRIYVSERGTGPNGRNVLVMHDDRGEALAAIGNKGRGPGEYLQIGDFDVDPEGRIHIYDSNVGSKKIFIYAPDGKFVGERQLPFSADQFRCTPDGGYLMTISTWEETEGLAGKRFVKTDADLNVLNVTGEWDPAQIDNNMRLGNDSFVILPEGTFSLKTPDETIYCLDDEGNITARWFLDLGSLAIPPADRSDLYSLYSVGKLDSFRILIDFIAPWGDHIFGRMRDRGETKSYVYDIKSGVNYTSTSDGAALYERFKGISDGRLIASFPAFDGETLPAGLPEEMRARVLSGDPLLVLYSLK